MPKKSEKLKEKHADNSVQSEKKVQHTRSSFSNVVVGLIILGLIIYVIYLLQSPATQEEVTDTVQKAKQETKQDINGLGQQVETLQGQVTTLEDQLNSTEEELEKTKKTMNEVVYKDDALGLQFSYPKSWGDVMKNEKTGFSEEEKTAYPESAGRKVTLAFSNNSNATMGLYSADYNAYNDIPYSENTICQKVGVVQDEQNGASVCYENPNFYYVTKIVPVKEGDSSAHMQDIARVALKDDIYTKFEFTVEYPEGTVQIYTNQPAGDAGKNIVDAEKEFLQTIIDGKADGALLAKMADVKGVVESLKLPTQ